MATTAIAAPHARAAHDPLTLWHLLSLDAPTVAALWAAFAAYPRATWHASAALGVAVWMLYAADRLADATHSTERLEERHCFHARHARAFRIAIAVACCALLPLVVSLPHPLRTAWMLLALPLLGYVAAVHVLHLRLPKEAMVGVFFGAVTLMPSLIATPAISQVADAVLFGTLCWLNCVFIARSERAATLGTAWITQRFPAAILSLATAALVIASTLPQTRAVALAVTLSALLLRTLDAERDRFSTLHTRALADAALLSPLLLWPLLPHLQ